MVVVKRNDSVAGGRMRQNFSLFGSAVAGSPDGVSTSPAGVPLRRQSSIVGTPNRLSNSKVSPGPIVM